VADSGQDTIFHSPRDTQPLVVPPPTFTAPTPGPVIDIGHVPVTLRVT
jgi:hypothetical protein